MSTTPEAATAVADTLGAMTPAGSSPQGLRERRRRDTGRRIQDIALSLFETRGFDAVTVEAVAAAAGVSPMTVYRHFGSKENLVLQDGLLAGLTDALADRLGNGGDIRTAMEEVLRSLPDDADGEWESTARRRIRLVNEVPAVAGAAHIRARAAAADLAEAVLARGGVTPLEARVAVLALLSALEAACDHWCGSPTGTSLRNVTAAAVHALHRL